MSGEFCCLLTMRVFESLVAHLNPMAVHIGHNNVSLRVHSHIAGIIKLSIPITE